MAKKHTMQELYQFQALSLSQKVEMTKARIKAWVDTFGLDGVYISFSGGKDSTVLLHIARQMYPTIQAVFVDVPTQYPELRTFAEKFENLEVLKPKISFMQVCEKYGFPLISKEVSECVSGARKYLTSILQSENALTDRQTDSISIATSTTRLLVKANTQSLSRMSGGGYDNKYRKLRGIGEYNATRQGKPKRGSETNSFDAWNVDNSERSENKGDYP